MSHLPLPPPVVPFATAQMRVYRFVYANSSFWYSIDVMAPSAERANFLAAADARRAEEEERRECGSSTPYILHFSCLSPVDDGEEFESDGEKVYFVESGSNG